MGLCCDVEGTEPDRLGLHVASTIAAFLATIAGWLLPVLGFPALSFPSFVVAYGAAGWDASIRAARALRCRELDVDVLMLLAAAPSLGWRSW